MNTTKSLMNKFALLGLALAFVFGLAATADAQDVKIGYTDPEVIIAQMPDYRRVVTQLQQMAEGGQTEYQRKVQDFQTKMEEYQRRQALLSDEARSRREEELTTAQMELQQFLQTKEQEMGQREVELMQPLFERVDRAITEIARERGLDLVFSARAGNVPVLLFASDRAEDITEPIMRKLGITPQGNGGASR